MTAALDEVQGMLRQDVFTTILKLGVLGAVLLTMPGLPSSFQPSHSQSYPPPAADPTSTTGPYPPPAMSKPPTNTATPSPTRTATVPVQPPALPTSTPTVTPRSYPPAPTRPLPAWTETPRSYQPQPEPTRPPSPYPSRPTPASPYPPAGATWPAIQLGAIVIAALGIAGVAVCVRFYRRRVA